MTAPFGQDEPAEDPLRREALEWLGKVRAGPDPETERAFRAWHEADPRHKAMFESVLATWRLNGASALTPTADVPDRLAKYDAGRRFRNCLAIAASLVLGLVVIAGIARIWMTNNAPSVVRQERLASGANDIRTTTLPDGSRVTLDGASELAANFTAAERRVTLLHGRARFDVAHDPDHPFIVTAGGREVVAHGTVFDVDLRAQRLAVSLIRGSIEVRTPTRPGPGQQPQASPPPGRYLLPGQRLVIEKDDRQAQPVAMPPDEADWTTPTLTFDDRPLSEVIAQANRHGSGRIVLAQPALQSLRYTGTIRTRDNQDIAQMIAATFGLDIARGQQGTILLAQRN
ncbi:FecR domain-containing protein [Novosphingobium sp.]|uniref:FecR family protein n=1 Tax=Novosphingobium sp. TaxID=1874826 RepID=UPI0031DDDEB6